MGIPMLYTRGYIQGMREKAYIRNDRSVCEYGGVIHNRGGGGVLIIGGLLGLQYFSNRPIYTYSG
jgi:hypothetical protein